MGNRLVRGLRRSAEDPANDQNCDDSADADESELDRGLVQLGDKSLFGALHDPLGAGSDAQLVEGAGELVASGLDLALDLVGIPGHMSSNVSQILCVTVERRALADFDSLVR